MAKSLKTIAETLGLSKATVSWILSGQGESRGFSAATIKLVENYAEQIGYRTNQLARSLSTGETHTIGLIIPAIGDTFYSQMTQAVERHAQQYGYALIVSSSEGDGEKEKQLIQMMRAQQVAGLIIAPAKGIQSCVDAMLADSYPFVFIDRYYPSLNSNYVIVNNEQSSYALVDRLAELGCRKIAVLTTDIHLLVMNMRINGYKESLKNRHIEFDESLCVTVDRSCYQRDIVWRLDRLLTEHPDVDGLFFSTHYLALEAIRYFINNGIDYNGRFKMACFHTTQALDILAPKMLLSMMPIDKMGARAVDILIANIKDRSAEVRQEVLENELLL